MTPPLIKKEEEFDSVNSNSISITITDYHNQQQHVEKRGTSIAERRAAKCGFNASNVNAALSPPPYFTVPPGLSPSALLDSPVMLPNAEAQMSPTTGTFYPSPNHESLWLKLKITSNGKEACSSETNLMADSNYKEFEYGNKECTESEAMIMLDNGKKKEASKINSDDGFYWRKYGQKHVKGSEYPRSYYKCTNTNCPVTKKVERSHDGHIAEIVYKGTHNHPQPKQIAPPIDVDAVSSTSSTLTTATSSPDPPAAAAAEHEEADAESEVAKKRKRESETSMAAAPRSAAREPKVVVQLESEIDILDDGYRWRKYGQKVVKGNPNPRSYYKCTTANCPVRKHVERAANDIKSVITTYEGKHTHVVPCSKTGINSDTAANPAPPSSKAAAGKQQLVQEYLDRKPMFNYSGGGDVNFGASPPPYPLPFPPFHSMPYASALPYEYMPLPMPMPMPMPMQMPMSMPMPMPSSSSSSSCMPPFGYGGEAQPSRGLKPKEEQEQLYDTCLTIPNNGNM